MLLYIFGKHPALQESWEDLGEFPGPPGVLGRLDVLRSITGFRKFYLGPRISIQLLALLSPSGYVFAFHTVLVLVIPPHTKNYLCYAQWIRMISISARTIILFLTIFHCPPTSKCSGGDIFSIPYFLFISFSMPAKYIHVPILSRTARHRKQTDSMPNLSGAYVGR